MLKRTLVTLAISLLLAPGVVIFAMMLLSERPRETLLVPWSRDGEWIAFSCGNGIDHETYAIYRMRPDGRDVQQVTSSGSIDRSPTWSPDGEWIAFVSQRYDLFGEKDDREIYRVRPDGTDLQQLTDNSSDEKSPNWSPDGKLIAFVSNLDSINWNIYFMNSTGNEATQVITQSYPFLDPLWSLDGEWLVVFRPASPTRSGSIYRLRPDGTGQQLLTDNVISIGDNSAWSPDGKWIVFSSKDEDRLGSNLAIMRSDGTQRHFITAGDGAYWSSGWSPDSQWIAFSYYDQQGSSQIYKIRPDGTDRQQLTNEDCNAISLTWSPDFDQLSKPEETDF